MNNQTLWDDIPLYVDEFKRFYALFGVPSGRRRISKKNYCFTFLNSFLELIYYDKSLHKSPMRC